MAESLTLNDVEDKTMKKTYTKPEMQVIMIQQQGCLLTDSGKNNRYIINRIENEDEMIRFKDGGFDDDEEDL